MGRIVVTEFMSLDGVVEDPGGAEDFKHGGWSFEFSRGDEGDKFKLDETMSSEALLLGRVTYEGFAKAWPSRDGEFADKFNSDAQVRRLLDAGEPRVEQLDRAEGRRRGGGHEAEAGAGRRHRGPRQPPARADADRERPRRRAPADGLPGRAGKRQATLRRDERQENAAAGRLEDRSATEWRSSPTRRRRRSGRTAPASPRRST